MGGVVFQVGERPLHTAQFDVVIGCAVKLGLVSRIPFGHPVDDADIT